MILTCKDYEVTGTFPNFLCIKCTDGKISEDGVISSMWI